MTELHEAHLHSSPSNIEHCLSVGAMYLPNKMHCSLIQILHMEPLCVYRGCRACCCAETGGAASKRYNYVRDAEAMATSAAGFPMIRLNDCLLLWMIETLCFPSSNKDMSYKSRSLVELVNQDLVTQSL